MHASIDRFISAALEWKYYYPNKDISKKERANWRNTVKRMLKGLSAFTPSDAEYPEVVKKRMELYDVLARGCSTHTFVSTDPFHALGYESQTACVEEVCNYVRELGDVSLFGEMLHCLVCGNLDDVTGYDDVTNAILSVFTQPEERAQLLDAVMQELPKAQAYYKAHYDPAFHTTEEILGWQRLEHMRLFAGKMWRMLGQPDKAQEVERQYCPMPPVLD